MPIATPAVPYIDTLEAGSLVTISVPTGASAVFSRIGSGAGSTTCPGGLDTVVGPFLDKTQYRIEAIGAACSVLKRPTQIVVAAAAPNNADGRPDGTIYIQTA